MFYVLTTKESRAKICHQKIHFIPSGLGCSVHSKVAVLSKDLAPLKYILAAGALGCCPF